MTNPTPHGQVPEALIDLIDAYAETRHRCGGIYNAKTEAARKAVIEALSGVQALSAAPAVPHEPTNEMYRAAQKISLPYDDDGGTIILNTSQIRALWHAMLAASPTPPAEQQAQPGAVGRTGCTAGTDEECTRRGCATSCPAQQAAPKAAPGELFDSEGFRAWVRKNLPDDTIIWNSAWWADHLTTWAQRFVKAAPQQEPATVPRFNCWSTNEGDSWFDHPADAQAIYDCLGNDAKVGDEYELTAGWKSVTARYRITEVVGDGEEYEVECISHQQGNTAPQPAPAPLSEQDPLQGAANWLAQAHGQFCVSVLQGCLMIGHNRAKRLHDAALAAQGGKV